jgi:hypothetical protein
MTSDRPDFQFDVSVYDQNTVIKLLQNYMDIRSTLIDRMPKNLKPVYTSAKQTYRERPRGSSASTPWPFMTKSHAQPHIDGKKRARMQEELHVCAIDLEEALKRLKDDEFKLIADYYIIGGTTIEAVAESRGLLSKGRLQERIQRIVAKLVRYMNSDLYEKS